MTQMTRKITFLLIFILCVCGAKAQEVADTTQQIDIFYSSPKTYELAGVKIVGGGDHYDDDYLSGCPYKFRERPSRGQLKDCTIRDYFRTCLSLSIRSRGIKCIWLST